MNEKLPLPVADTTVGFPEAYDTYAEARNVLHATEVEGGDTHPKLLVDVLNAKEQVAKAALTLYARSSSIDELRQRIDAGFSEYVGNGDASHRTLADDAKLGAYLLPLSLTRPEIPSAIESVEATTHNIDIAHTFAEGASSWATGMLLSGSAAWGPFYAVRGGVPKQLQEMGIPQLPYKEISDVDLLAVVDGLEHIHDGVEGYIAAGLFPVSERERFAVFLTLHRQGKADMFSVRTHHAGVEESIHFVPIGLLERIGNMERIQLAGQEVRGMDVVRDFRPNAKNGHYTVNDLRGGENIAFKPTLKAVTYAGREFGYVSSSPVGGLTGSGEDKTYMMGLLPFFLSIEPALLLDTDGRLSRIVGTLQDNIASTLRGQPPQNIPRSARMPKHALYRVQRALS